MKKKEYTILLITLLTTLFISCIHDYPGMTAGGEKGVDPTLVEINTEVTLDLEFVPLEVIISKARSEVSTSGYRRRFIIEALRNGHPEVRQEMVMDEMEESGEGITLPVNLRLHAVEYTLAVWTDYVRVGTDGMVSSTGTDLYYNTENFQQVVCTEPYTGSTDRRDCLYGTVQLDLRPYRDEWNAKVQVRVDMERPLAKYEIIATDVEEFLRKTRGQRSGSSSAGSIGDEDSEGIVYTISFSYGFYLPIGFNIFSGKPGTSLTGVQFTTPLVVPTDGSKACRLGSDFVFVNGTESFVLLTMEIKDADGKVVSRTRGLKVPYRRGHLTTVRSNFLTNEMQGGIGIDPGFDGDIDIDLDASL